MFKRFFIFISLYLFSISNSFAAMVTFNQSATIEATIDAQISGIHFNKDGTKMFAAYMKRVGGNGTRYIREYNLSKPFDISTKVYAGDSERCNLTGTTDNSGFFIYDLEFSSDGKKLIVVQSADTNINGGDKLHVFNLTSPYDVSTCVQHKSATHLDFNTMTHGSQAGDYSGNTAQRRYHRVQGVEVNDDGTKIFLLWTDYYNAIVPDDKIDGVGDITARVYEYNLSTPYDVSEINAGSSDEIVKTAGIPLPDTLFGANAPRGMRFSSDGKKIFFIAHDNTASTNSVPGISQVSLDKPFDTSSYTLDGGIDLSGLSTSNDAASGLSFSENGLKLYIGDDNGVATDQIMEYDLACPFNIIEGSCPAIANKDRIGIAEAQITIAKRTIDHSTDSVLNRLKWIRRNKDNQNLSNLNIDYNLNIPQLGNPLINTLVQKIPEKITIHQASFKKKTDNKKEDVFYWSEGSVSFGRIGDTNISSSKIIETDAIIFGADRYLDNNGILGAAFRFGKNDIDVGNLGSNLDTDTYNFTFYSTSPIDGDTQFLDTVVGFGELKSDILSVVDGENLTADRDGRQIYGSLKIKDEIKKDNFTLIPSGRIDIGHTTLDSYKETGPGAIKVKKQTVRSKKLRLGVAATDDFSNDKYYFKRHGKLEYVADIDRSSDFKYNYIGDANGTTFHKTLHSESLHNLNGELGVDIVLPSGFSIFMIYERNQALRNSHTDKIHLALGYLPNKETNYTFNLAGSENLGSEFKITKNINNFEIDFNLNNQDVLKPNSVDQASINLIRKF